MRLTSLPAKTATRPTAPAAILRAPQTFDVLDETIPEPAEQQVRVRIEGCGLCGSNLPVWKGRDWFDYPLEPGAPGHEAWGTIDKLGDNVEGLQVGQRVACLSYRAFAAYDVADAGAVVPLPDTFNDLPFPAEPLACAINVFRRCRIHPGESVAVVGIGFLGALLVQLATRAGAEVVAVSQRRFALEVALRCGAVEAIQLSKKSGAFAGRTGTFSCVIEATGAQTPLDVASELTGVRGRLVIAGYHQDGARTVNMQQWNWKGIDVINAHEREPRTYIDGMRAAVRAVERGELDLNGLITHEFPLSRINEAFERASVRPNGFLKAIVLSDEF